MTSSSRARRLRLAAVLLIVQSVLMELSVFVGLIALLASGVPQQSVIDRADIFALPYLNENLYLMMAMSGIFGTLRLIGAIGLWRNRLWGLALSAINCAVTMTLMLFMLPAGVLDGILSGTALVLMLGGWLGARSIVDVDLAEDRGELG
ncbi:hypothetical protein [Pseudoclavibacter sp. AY1F1]|uniref:hypothetical protein n=1 Tax=Pseudoclavibacter sp. AY1F1 TaxID=2080583 RepID=UPI0015E326FF|nr:hypothetical protein [Pseudoclavibacter sp. AY1F1]